MPRTRRHVILISGKDSLAAALVQRERAPGLPYEYVFNPTGWDLPETLEWIERVGRFLGRPVVRVGEDLSDKVDELGMLPGPNARFCTWEGKIRPIHHYLKGDGRQTVVYYGLRADEPERTASARHYTTPAFPLRDAGMGVADVWRLCESVGLLPPAFHWAWLERRVRERLTVTASPGVRLYHDRFDALPAWTRRSLLAWRSRSNCDRCFYQRRYEWVGLMEYHPQLFERACEMEESLVGRRSEPFTVIQGRSLRSLGAEAGEIRERRAAEVAGMIRGNTAGEKMRSLDVISCGLVCGK